MPRSKKGTAATMNGDGILAEATGSTPDSHDPPTTTQVLLVPSLDEREPVKINNANLAELKHACDDALSRFLSRPELFKQNHTHMDVRLGLGWAGVFVAGATALYGYKVEFEKSKPVVWAGVILYMLLTVTQSLYTYFIEKDIVYQGRRKTFDKRIETERITISSSTLPSTPSTPPRYALALSYIRSSNGGKSILARSTGKGERGYDAFFDEAGVLDQVLFEEWVAGLVGPLMS